MVPQIVSAALSSSNDTKPSEKRAKLRDLLWDSPRLDHCLLAPLIWTRICPGRRIGEGKQSASAEAYQYPSSQAQVLVRELLQLRSRELKALELNYDRLGEIIEVRNFG